MDRRSAIKKLAVGGTVGSAVVLTRPAFAGASPAPASLSAKTTVTSAGETTYDSTTTATVSLSTPSCVGGGTATVTYRWFLDTGGGFVEQGETSNVFTRTGYGASFGLRVTATATCSNGDKKSATVTGTVGTTVAADVDLGGTVNLTK